MVSSFHSQKKYEEYSYVLDFIPRGRSQVIKGREGPIVQAVGEDMLTLLEILALNGVEFEIGERIYIGKDGRTKIVSVLGKLIHEELTSDAKNELEATVENLVKNKEEKYIDIINHLQPVTPRLHALELIPGIGKTFMNQMLTERDRQPFISFQDLQERTGLRDPAKLISKRIVEEMAGGSRISIFVRR
jgi:putative nucleotide binding protein